MSALRHSSTRRPVRPPSIGFARSQQALRRFAQDRSGNVVVLAGLMLPMLIGGMGLGAEAGYWYLKQRQLQHAADVAAYAAGVRKKAGDDKQSLESVAARIAGESSFNADSGTVTVNNPPTSGAFAGDAEAVEVILDETVQRAFSSLFLADDLALSGRAVVAVNNSDPACVLALNPSKDAAIELTGSADVSLSGCHVAANSSDPDAFSMTGNAALKTECVHTVGGAYVQKQHKLDMECEEVDEGISPVADPYADLVAPACGGAKVYCHTGLSWKNEIELDEGIYIIDGGTLEITANAVVTGDNVTFFFKNGAKVDIQGNAEIDLKAPTDPSNPYTGVLFFGDRGDANTSFSMKGNAGGIFQGAIYFPSGHVEFTGRGALESECIQLIADTVKLTGNADFKGNCEGTGVRQAHVAGSLRIVE